MGVREGHALQLEGTSCPVELLGVEAAPVGKRRLGVEDLADALARGRAAREDDDEVGDIDDGEQRLGHVVDEGHDLALGQLADRDAQRTRPQDGNDAQVHDEKGGGAQHCGEPSYGDGGVRLVVRRGDEALRLAALAPERADDAHTREGLAADDGDLVELCLHHAVVRHGA